MYLPVAWSSLQYLEQSDRITSHQFKALKFLRINPGKLTMLKETPVAQKEKGLVRRWFEDEYFQLIVWYKNDSNTIIGF